MKLLENEFEGKGEVSGTRFKQLQKTDKAFFYQLTHVETGQNRFEVFKKKESKGGLAIIACLEVRYEQKQIYPKSNNFGKWAWCFYDYEKAAAKFNEIC